jgi:HPt (histidine-containing phosphotransfer) domain-containing protein
VALQFDPSRLDAIGADAPDLVRELVALFGDDVASRLKRLREAIDGGDAESTKRTAHGIRGAAVNIGAEVLATLAEALEYPESGAVPEGSTDRLEAEFKAVNSILQQRYCE